MAKKSKYATVTDRMRQLYNEDPCMMFDDRIVLKVYLSQFHHITTFMQIYEDSKCPAPATILRARRLFHKRKSGPGCPRLEETINSRVEYLLRTVPATRNSDKLLTAMFLANYHSIHTLSEYVLDYRAPELSSIWSQRRIIQKSGRYLADPIVNIGRKTEEFNHFHHFRRR